MQYENIYVGRRYVPLPCGEWNDSKEYEALSVVLYTDGNSYTSIKPVPAGIVPTNESYWALTGQGNTAIQQATEKITEIGERVEKLETIVPENGWYTIDHYGIKNDGYTNNFDSFKSIPSNEGVILRPGVYLVNKNSGGLDSIYANVYVSPGAYLKTTTGKISFENIVAGDYRIVNTDDAKKLSLYSANGEGLNMKWYGSWDAAKQIIDDTTWAPVISGLSGSLSGGGNYYIPDSSILISNPYRSINSMEDTANIICKGRAKFDTVSFQMSANKEILTFFNFSQQTKKDLRNPVVFNNCRFTCNTNEYYRVEKGTVFENFGTLIFEKCYFMVNTKLTENLLFFKNCDTVVFRDCSFTDLGNTLTGNFILSENTNNFTFDNCQIKASETATFLHENNTSTWETEKAERIFNGVYTDKKIKEFFVHTMTEGYSDAITGISFNGCEISCVNSIVNGDTDSDYLTPTAHNFSNNFFYSDGIMFSNVFGEIVFENNTFKFKKVESDYEAMIFTQGHFIFSNNRFFPTAFQGAGNPTLKFTYSDISFVNNNIGDTIPCKLVVDNSAATFLNLENTEFRVMEEYTDILYNITRTTRYPRVNDVKFSHFGKINPGDYVNISPTFCLDNGYNLDFTSAPTSWQNMITNVKLVGNYESGTTIDFLEDEKKWKLTVDSDEKSDKIFVSFDYAGTPYTAGGGEKLTCFEVTQDNLPGLVKVVNAVFATPGEITITRGTNKKFSVSDGTWFFNLILSDGSIQKIPMTNDTVVKMTGTAMANSEVTSLGEGEYSVAIDPTESAHTALLIFEDLRFNGVPVIVPFSITVAAG